MTDSDAQELEALPDAELRAAADALGVAGARWLPRAALVRTILTIRRARRLAERVRGLVREVATAAMSGAAPPTPPPAEPPAPAPDAVPPTTLASETIARLYEAQGKPGKAAAVRRAAGERLETPPPRRRHDDASRVAVAVEAGALRVRWDIADRAWRGAELRLGAAGRPGVRVAASAPGRAPAAIDVRVSHDDAEASVPLPDDAWVWAVAAVGLLSDDGRFAPAAHAAPCRIGAGGAR